MAVDGALGNGSSDKGGAPPPPAMSWRMQNGSGTYWSPDEDLTLLKLKQVHMEIPLRHWQ